MLERGCVLYGVVSVTGFWSKNCGRLLHLLSLCQNMKLTSHGVSPNDLCILYKAAQYRSMSM